MANFKFDRFNDGIVRIYREKEKKTSFAAKQNVSALEDLEFIVKLDFGESTKREKDLEFAAQNGFSLSLKIRTRYHAQVENKCKAIIDNYLYDVSYVDKTRDKMWLYMEGVKTLDT